jgi:hypothetical protein
VTTTEAPADQHVTAPRWYLRTTAGGGNPASVVGLLEVSP